VPYPMPVNPYTIPAGIYTVDIAPPVEVLDSVTYTWNHHFSTIQDHWSIFDPYQQTVTFNFIGELLPILTLDNVSQRWAGLGGLVYIPSFPQLNRNATTWPHAT
jgi:hypothetical protein